MDDLDDFLNQVKSSQEDIAESEALEFVERWNTTLVTIPATFVSWRNIASSVLVQLVESGHKDALGTWKDKAVSKPEIVEALGAFGNYIDVFIDYINIERKASMKQTVSLFEKVGYLDLVLDNEGKESYVPKNTEGETEAMIKAIDDMIQAYENFR